MKATEKVVLDGLRKTTLKYLSDEDYAQIVDAVEKQGLLGLTGAAGRMVKTAVIKHGSHDQKTHGRGGKGGGGGGSGSSTPTKEPQDAGQRMWDEANTLRTANSRDTVGTSKQGEVRATREQLTEALGNPEIGGMDKSTIEWGVVDRKTGVVATVYDWKRNPESGSRSEYATKPPEMNEILEYQIGGTNGAVELVSNALLQAKQNKTFNALLQQNKTNKSIVTKHGSHDQKTHGRKGGGGGGGGGSSESVGTIGIGGANEKEELAGLAYRAENDTQSLANEAEDIETGLLNSGLGVNSPDVRGARSMRGNLRDAKDIFEGSKKIKDLGEKRKKLTSGYKKLERAFVAADDSDISEGISRVMADLEQGLGLDARD